MLRLEQARRAAQQATIAAQIKACQTCHTAESWTDALVGISRKIAEMGGVDSVLLNVVETARNLLAADTAVLALWNESGSQLEVKYFANSEGVKIGDSQPVTNPILLEAVNSLSTQHYPGSKRAEDGRLHCMMIGQEIKTAAIVPLKLENQPFGGLWVGRLQEAPFASTDLIGLESLADQAVIAITHSLMADRMQSLAVLEERSRLAREMHDGLAQILGYLRLETQAIEAMIQSGDYEESLESLRQARQNIDLAQADVRENILSLRTTLSGKAGVVATLQEYLQEYSIQTGIEVHFVSNLNSEPSLSPTAEMQMVRIVQEALTNVRKHAQAQAVQLRLEASNGHLSALVTDDGVGFDLTPERGHYGLQTMQERALNVGGAVTVNSSPGQGTQVELWLPLFEKCYAM
jgi:signal transduction histidine kinase